MKGVAILGATGSIGRSTLAVLDQHPDEFRVVALSAHRNGEALRRLAAKYRPSLTVLVDSDGREALLEAATHPDVDIVLNALVGAAGLEPTLAALRAGKRVALANKESLVCGGELVLRTAAEAGGELVPVDSEHSAILQCIRGSGRSEVRRLILTASGGPFRDFEPAQLAAVQPMDALRHPTWEMGAKVTIDSATLANKALEVIEAHHLFGVEYQYIEAVIHPQSIVHSLVEFVDGSVLAQLGFPNMELPIVYALGYPERLPYACRRFDPIAAGPLTFAPVRTDCFPAFELGVDAGRVGGTAPAVFNAANEVAVAAFLDGRLPFPGIAAVLADVLHGWDGGAADTLDKVLEADACARREATTLVQGHVLC